MLFPISNWKWMLLFAFSNLLIRRLKYGMAHFPWNNIQTLSLAWSQYILLRPHWSNTTQHHLPHLIIVQLFQICNETISFSVFIPLHFNISHRQQKYLLSRVHLNIYKAPRKYIHIFFTQTLSINLNFLTSYNPSLPTCKTFPQLQRSKIIMFRSILLLHQI